MIQIRSDKEQVRGSGLLRQVQQRGARSWTGALRFRVGAWEASLFLYEGEAYSAELGWYAPRLVQRLAAAGVLDATRMAILDSTVGMDCDPMAAARFGVEQGWLSAERLGAIHGEYLLASVGAVMERAEDIEAEDGATTDRFCALPIGYEDLADALAVRTERDAATWTFTCPAGSTSLSRAMPAVVPEHQVPEVLAFLDAVDQPLALDIVAGRCGFTRAEAAFIATSLAAQGVILLSPGGPVAGSPVPEAVPL